MEMGKLNINFRHITKGDENTWFRPQMNVIWYVFLNIAGKKEMKRKNHTKNMRLVSYMFIHDKSHMREFLPFSTCIFYFSFFLCLPFVAPVRVWYSSENRNNQEHVAHLYIYTYKIYIKKDTNKLCKRKAESQDKLTIYWVFCMICKIFFLSFLIPLKFTMNFFLCWMKWKFSYLCTMCIFSCKIWIYIFFYSFFPGH
jgi:hypothetical protein